MATYKVIQDIEAEDKLLGPLTLRQFIYALIAAVCLYFCFLSITKGVVFMLVIFLPPALFTGFFAFPWGRDQPTEVWALAKIQFMLKPHKRIWNQSGVKELVTITAPKKQEENYTNGLSQMEVRSRLHALADTIDSRGWAIKNVNVNMYAQPTAMGNVSSDRLIDINSLPQEVSPLDITAADDMLDAQNNPLAQQFDQMMAASSQAHRQQVLQQLAQPATSTPITPAPQTQSPQGPPADYWFLNQPTQQAPKGTTTFTPPQVVLPGQETTDPTANVADPTPNEAALAEALKAQHDAAQSVYYGHLHTILPLSQQQASTPVTQSPPQRANAAAQPTPPAPPAQPDRAILELASNNDLDVATLARQANIAHTPKEPPEDEVVVSLH